MCEYVWVHVCGVMRTTVHVLTYIDILYYMVQAGGNIQRYMVKRYRPGANQDLDGADGTDAATLEVGGQPT